MQKQTVMAAELFRYPETHNGITCQNISLFLIHGFVKMESSLHSGAADVHQQSSFRELRDVGGAASLLSWIIIIEKMFIVEHVLKTCIMETKKLMISKLFCLRHAEALSGGLNKFLFELAV